MSSIILKYLLESTESKPCKSVPRDLAINTAAKIIAMIKQAMINIGLDPIASPIRGGTDGANLSFMGLPCPNLGTGGYNYHGPYEFCSINSMKKGVKLLLELIKEA